MVVSRLIRKEATSSDERMRGFVRMVAVSRQSLEKVK
jgi:hypothetical protein